jgi:nucleotide-binding universal stress UspA family protein
MCREGYRNICVAACRLRVRANRKGLVVIRVVIRVQRTHDVRVSQSSRIVVATDLTEASEPALVRGHAHSLAVGSPLVVCHVIPDVLRHHPLLPSAAESDAAASAAITKRAAELVSNQVGSVLKIAADAYTVEIETGDAEDEIVRIAEAEGAEMIVVGAKPRTGVQRVLGHVAERVVRYARTSVLVARNAKRTGKILVATDFAERAIPAMKMASTIVKAANVDATLLHVMQLPNNVRAAIGGPLGASWAPPTQAAIDALESLGRTTLEGLAKEYGFAHVEQIDGEPAEKIVKRAEELSCEMIILGCHGRTGLARLLLGSVAERVVRDSHCSVLVVR